MSASLIWKCRLCDEFVREPFTGIPLDELNRRIAAPTNAARIGTHVCAEVFGLPELRRLGVTELVGASETIEEEKKP